MGEQLATAGHDIVFSERARPVKNADLAITCGFQMTKAIAQAMRDQIPVIVLENPVWYDEGAKSDTYTWAYNGLHGGGWMPSTANLPPRPHPELLEWKDWEEGRITIFGQVPTDKAVRGADLPAWIRHVQEVLTTAEFREHPIMIPSKLWPNMESFDECMAKTSLAVTYTSTCGAEAVIAGIPTIACHPGSLAYPVSTHNLSDTPITPDRTDWIRDLSYKQWTIHEALDVNWILSGYDEAKAMAEAGQYDNMSNGRAQGPDYYITDNH